VLLEMLGEAPVVVVSGPRQAGKSTLASALIADSHEATYHTLDDMTLLDAATRDPQGFIEGFGSGSVVVDEVQMAPDLFRAIKLSVDRDRRPGRFLLTGSSDPSLMPQMANSLAGRMRALTLWPLSEGEIDGVPSSFIDRVFGAADPFRVASAGVSRRDLLARIVRGGFPEVVRLESGAARERWMTDYVTRMVERDVPRMSEIADRLAIPRILKVLAGRTMQLLNLSEVSRLTETKRATLDRYIALLQAAYLVRMIPAWSGDISRQVAKRPKPIITDSGLACHLVGAAEDRLLADTRLLGSMLEGFVAAELLRQSSFSSASVAISHFRTDVVEVDIVLEDTAGRLVGIEVKATATPTSGDLGGLRQFAQLVGGRFVRGVLLHTGTSSAPFGEGLWALPICSLWER
jgi:predicted AAA+ superfamily ATPase